LNALLIAGTDTNSGKTVLTTALVAYWQTFCLPSQLGLIKLLQTGTGDRELYSRLFQLQQTPEELNPVYFEAPLAPPLAAKREGRSIDIEKIWQTLEGLRAKNDFVVAESLGGLGSPVTHDMTVADLAWDWRLPTVLVVPVRLGSISQAVANVALAQQARVHLKGIVLNCVQPCFPQDQEDWAPVQLIQSLTGIPVLGTIPYLSDPTDLSKLTQIASDLLLEHLIPLPY
jgi:dethiobiotin synthetase